MKIDSIKLTGPVPTLKSPSREILTPDALKFIAKLHSEFENKRQELLLQRETRQKEISGGKLPDFLSETIDVRESDWKVASIKPDLEKRWVEYMKR